MLSRVALVAAGPAAARRRRSGPAARLPLVAIVLAILAGLVAPLDRASAAPRSNDGVATLTGSVTIANPHLLASRSDPYVMLRDVTWFDSDEPERSRQQVLGGLEGDVAEGAEFTLSLPIAPQGQGMDTTGGRSDDGLVQVYEVEVVSDAIGDPFLGAYERWWGNLAASIQFEGEEWRGTLVVWSPDDEQLFPTSAGKDGVVFTDDDPLEPIEAGWTVVNLGGRTFDFDRDETVEVELAEPENYYTDLSDLGYIDAFDTLVDDLRVRYAFKDVKQIDFDAIVDEVRPLIVAAEAAEDSALYHEAMLRFVTYFGDGHVAMTPADDGLNEYIIDRYAGGVGLRLGETDEGELIVTEVVADSPADEAGIEPGAEILTWDGDSPEEALGEVELLWGESSPHGLRQEELLLLPRMTIGETVELKFRNPDERRSEMVELEALAEWPILPASYSNNPAELPVTASVLPSGVGYIRVNTFFDDVALMFDSWEWAMSKMIELDVPALIVDVRGNGGGWGQIATYFAGSFTEEEFVLADYYQADEDGEFQWQDSLRVEPSPLRWEKPVAVLIDSRCASACEIFSASMGHNPDVVIVGQTPTSGVEAGVFPWTLPEDLYFQASISLILDEDGEVFVEGAGVPPTLDVPVTAESLLSPEDEVLLTAEAEMLAQG